MRCKEIGCKVKVSFFLCSLCVAGINESRGEGKCKSKCSRLRSGQDSKGQGRAVVVGTEVQVRYGASSSSCGCRVRVPDSQCFLWFGSEGERKRGLAPVSQCCFLGPQAPYRLSTHTVVVWRARGAFQGCRAWLRLVAAGACLSHRLFLHMLLRLPALSQVI